MFSKNDYLQLLDHIFHFVALAKLVTFPGRPSMDILVRSWQDFAKILEKF